MSPMSALSDALPRLSPRDRQFAENLLSALNRGRLSAKQAPWVDRLIERANSPRPAPVVAPLAGDVAAIFRLFETASAHALKWPKVRLQAEDGTPVVFSRAGERSQYAGQIQITDGGPFGANRYFGRIDQGGGLFEARAMTPAVRSLIERFAADPAAVGAAHGHKTGNCCFCSRDLSTKESVSVGYGPVCAEKFGLPWGEVAA